MCKKILKKLLVNALNELNDRYDNDGCNDLEKDDPLLTGISEEEFSELTDEWKRLLPEEAEDFEGNLDMNMCVVSTLVGLVCESDE